MGKILGANAARILPLLREQFRLSRIPPSPFPPPIRQLVETVRELIRSVGLRDFLDVSRFVDLPPAIEARRIEEEARIRAIYDRSTSLLLEIEALRAQGTLPGTLELERQDRIEAARIELNATFQQQVLLDEAVIQFIESRFGTSEDMRLLIREFEQLRRDADRAEQEHVTSVFFVPFNFENAQDTRKKREEAISAYLTFRQGLFRFLR